MTATSPTTVYRLSERVGRRVSRRPSFAKVIHEWSDGGWLLSERTARHGEQLWKRYGGEPSGIAIDADAWRAARARLIMGWAASVTEALPGNVEHEITLWLYARPGLRLEYMGRGRYTGRRPEGAELFHLDVAGGRRDYVFRRVASEGNFDQRSTMIHDVQKQRAEWIRDDDARVVLSIGGGGYRLFAALPALKVVERMLGGNRSLVDEVWGSSGGALLGYAFSKGLPLSVIDRLGFQLYHGQRRELPGLHLRSLAYYASRALGDYARKRKGQPELRAWVDAIDGMSKGTPDTPEVPFYALLSNTDRRHPVAACEAEHLVEHCRDFLIPCDSRDATAASMAVPFLFRPMTAAVPGTESKLWFDGSIAEENPILLPFVKWLRDRKRSPETTPKKLKLVVINLNLRLSESRLLDSLASVPLTASQLLVKATEVVDLLLDSKTQALVRTLGELPDVEVMTSSLNLGRLSFITRHDIPELIRSGQIVEGWNIHTHGAGSSW